MALRQIGPRLIAALACALAGAATGLVGCHDVGLYPLRANPMDGGGGQGGLGMPTDGPTDVPVDSGPPPQCPDKPVAGYATFSSTTDAGVFHAGTTGGGNLQPKTVTTLSDLMMLAADASPQVIIVGGPIQFPPIPDGGTGTPIPVASNKTIVGADNVGAELIGGGLDLTGSANVIIRNLKISKAYHSDAIHLQYSQDVWIDHCDLSCDTDPALVTACDDLVGITHASDYVTVSWTYYHDHHDTGIVGHSDSALAMAEDPGHLHVTYHHDEFYNVAAGPRIRFGKVHLYSIDFENISDYAVGATTMATVFVESTYFNNNNPVSKPLTTMVSGSPETATITEGTADRANYYQPPTSEADNVFTTMPQWNSDYPLDPATDAQSVPFIVQACARTGKVTPLPP